MDKILNICLENVSASRKFGMTAINVNGLSLKNVSVTAKEGEDSVFKNVKRQ